MYRKSKFHVSAHHIYTWANYQDIRYKYWNGITLCLECDCKTFRRESEFEPLFFNLLEQSLVRRINEIYHIKGWREKKNKGWFFIPDDFVEKMETIKLDTGDYSILGMEKIISIERKGTITEFAFNLIQDRFIRELERLEQIPHSFIILEFMMRDLISYPATSGLSPKVRSKIRITGKFLLKKFIELQCKFKTKIIFAGGCGKEITTAIFKQVVNEI